MNRRAGRTDKSRYSKRRTKVLARSGIDIDVSATTWRIDAGNSISWSSFESLPPKIVAATMEYMKHRISASSPSYVETQFSYLRTFANYVHKSGLEYHDNHTVGLSIFHNYRQYLISKYPDGTVSNYLDAYRRWYVWCADAGFEGFDIDVSIELRALVIGGNDKGSAVLSHDPNEGPLRDSEFQAIISRLKSPRTVELLSTFELVACRLMVAFGPNPKNLVWLNEEDLIKEKVSEDRTIYRLKIPRIKKRTAGPRDLLKPRPLSPELGKLVEELIAENRLMRVADPNWHADRFAAPLFCRRHPSVVLRGTAHEVDAYRVSTFAFNHALETFVRNCDLRSSAGSRLHLSPRRLRYTFATRLVQEGASPLELAEALDHTDVQHVMVYFNARSNIVTDLDRAMALKLAPHAQAFLGKLITSETKALRGRDPASRIYKETSEAGSLKTLGNCGQFGFCSLYAPIACYTCVDFQPWLDAPHGEVLRELTSERERRLKSGADPKFAQIHDRTILAVAEVILKCDAHRKASEK